MSNEGSPAMNKIEYPYIPEGRTIEYVGMDNEFMQAAKAFARAHSLDKIMPNSSVIVLDGQIIAAGANGSDYHNTHECERVKQNIPSGQGYELCEGCHPKNHGEQSAIASALANGISTQGADLYMWGHWWCCESCWNAMESAGINQVYLLDNSEKLFNKDHEYNIVGHQFKN